MQKPPVEERAAASPFERYRDQDVLDLIDSFPLAWVVPVSGEAPAALLPLLAETGGDGRLASVFGHMARHNPLVPALQADPRASILFTGPQGYVSTVLVTEPSWAPTWNYAQVQMSAVLEFVPEETGRSIEALTGKMEGAIGSDWQPAMVGGRYAAMERAIIAFRATVTTMSARFKLGQDESDVRFAEITSAMPDDALVAWMRRFRERT